MAKGLTVARGEYSRQGGALALLSLLEEVELREYGKLCRKVRESLDIPLDKLAWRVSLEPSQLEAFEKGLATPGVIPTTVLLRISMTLVAYQYIRHRDATSTEGLRS